LDRFAQSAIDHGIPTLTGDDAKEGRPLQGDEKPATRHIAAN
jgi:hypothetical protein